ncbi:hypothetical protein J2S92_000280 [Arthrobacter bambusae]|nr:hypothetical protein [Arthrobacter bambusae]MDQ0234051.1 hypothetical protein [Arthrobacter bambusae]
MHFLEITGVEGLPGADAPQVDLVWGTDVGAVDGIAPVDKTGYGSELVDGLV